MHGIGSKSMAIDSQWGNVAILYTFEGANNSTAIVEAKGKTATVSGNAKISTAQYPAGCYSSLLLDGNNCGVSMSSGANFVPGTGDFAVEIPVYLVGDTSAGNTYTSFIVDCRTTEPQNSKVVIQCHGSNEGAKSNRIGFHSGGIERILSSTQMGSSFKLVTLARVSGVVRLFIDGVQEGSSYSDTTYYSTAFFNTGKRYAAAGGNDYSFNGHLGPLRMTTNGRGYSSNFTPPSLPFPRPTISGYVYDSDGNPVSKAVVAVKRSTLGSPVSAISNGASGAYSLYPSDFSEHIVIKTDSSVYPLVDGSTVDNALIYDRVIPG